MRFQLEVIARRGTIAESRHHLEAALCDADGRLQAETSEPRAVTTFRSSAKPFQLLPLVERGHADRYGFSEEQLAVMAASHTGSPHHVALVQGLLTQLGLQASQLVCGFHEPSDPESLARLRSGTERPSSLYNNCSGKHVGLLALCMAEGWPLEGYHLLEHPLQQLLRRTVAECCGLASEALGTAVDGCSLVVFALPLSAMARGYARLVDATTRADGDVRTRALARIARAMTSHPVTVEGEGRVSTALMQVTKGRLLAKCGAEGLQLVGVVGGHTDRSLGLAIKCDDGAMRATGPATIAVLEHLGMLSGAELAALAEHHTPKVVNVVGLGVGHLEAVLRVVAHA